MVASCHITKGGMMVTSFENRPHWYQKVSLSVFWLPCMQLKSAWLEAQTFCRLQTGVLFGGKADEGTPVCFELQVEHTCKLWALQNSLDNMKLILALYILVHLKGFPLLAITSGAAWGHSKDGSHVVLASTQWFFSIAKTCNNMTDLRNGNCPFSYFQPELQTFLVYLNDV